jgi:hypothetical protein
VPEFYYLPEMFQNRNKLALGTKHTGEVIDDVVLPPWAKGDPREFVRKHRLVRPSSVAGGTGL